MLTKAQVGECPITGSADTGSGWEIPHHRLC